MKLYVENGKLSVTDGNTGILSDIYVGARYGGPKYNTLKTYNGQSWTLKRTEPFDEPSITFPEGCEYYIAESADARIFAASYDGGIMLRSEYENNEDKYAEPDYALGMIALGGIFRDTFTCAQANSLLDHNGIRTYEMQSDIHLRKLSEMESVESATHISAKCAAGEWLSAGFVTYEEHFSYVSLRSDGQLEMSLDFDNRVIPKCVVRSDWMRLSFADTLNGANKDFAEAVKDINSITLKTDSAPTGFCTWYYYLYNISEKTVFDNMEALDCVRDRMPLEVFQIDDGWGNARTNGNEKFPKGMKYYADYIKEHGMTPGIWLTPFNFGTWESVVTEHPDWFVKSGDELKLVNSQAIIDATNPDAAKYIEELYHKVTYDWGYRYIKLDHITTYLCGGTFHKPGAGALQNMRAYFKAMRKGCHPDTFILACTSPLFEVAGLADGVRTSGDIFESWESLHGVFKRNFARMYLNGVLFFTDPDCLMLRTSAEEDDECLRPVSRTDEENRTFAAAMHACGGALMISDKLSLLTENEIYTCSSFFPYKSKSATPEDNEVSEIPSSFSFPEKDGKVEKIFINWSDKNKSFTVKTDGKAMMSGYWNGKERTAEFDNEITLTLPPHYSAHIFIEKK